MLSRDAFDRYDRQVRNLADGAEDYTRRMLDAYMGQNPDASVEQCREFAREVMAEAVRIYGDAAATAAADYYDAAMEASGNGAPRALLSNAVDPVQVEKVARYQAGKLASGDVKGFVKECAAYVGDSAKRAANDTTLRNAQRDGRRGVRYARVPTGAETCTFCRMLASRGFVYKSDKSAGRLSHFHRNCDCRVVASTDADGLEGYDPDREYELWQRFEEIDAGEGTRAEKEAAKRAALGSPGPPVKYEKPKEAFVHERGGSYDLAAHEALRAAGHEVVVRKEDAPEGFSNIDLLLDGRLCELKSPTSDASGINGLRFIERNIRKAVKQFDKVEGGPVRPSIVVLNCTEVPVTREKALKRVRLEMSRHDIDRVILLTHGEAVDDIKKQPQVS